MKGILTKYIGPTNTKPGRVKAVIEGSKETVTITWDHGLGVRENHERAARTLLEQAHPSAKGRLVGATLPTACGFTYCFILCPEES